MKVAGLGLAHGLFLSETPFAVCETAKLAVWDFPWLLDPTLLEWELCGPLPVLPLQLEPPEFLLWLPCPWTPDPDLPCDVLLLPDLLPEPWDVAPPLLNGATPVLLAGPGGLHPDNRLFLQKIFQLIIW